MKKEYAVEDLRIGMKIAEPVLDENGTVVVEAGTVLDDESIFSILEQPVFGVMIDVDVPKHAPVKDEHILDDSYLADMSMMSSAKSLKRRIIRNLMSNVSGGSLMSRI